MSANSWHVIERVNSLNETVSIYKNICEHFVHPTSDFCAAKSRENEDFCHGNPLKKKTTTTTRESEDDERFICPLVFRNPNLPQTEAGRKLESIFINFHDETLHKGEKNKRKIKGLNRIEARKKERRKKIILLLQNKLEHNSEKYVARAANSVKYHADPGMIARNNAVDDIGVDPFVEKWPILLGGFDMNPELFLRLSCALMNTPSGDQVLKKLALQNISFNLFVYMYWFIHCRFFQVRLKPPTSITFLLQVSVIKVMTSIIK